MTDYLELAAGEDVDVLLEAERRGGVPRLSLRSEAGPEGDGRTERDRRGGSVSPGDRPDRGLLAEAPAPTEAGGDVLPKPVRQSGSAGLWDRPDRALRAEASSPAHAEARGDALTEQARRSGSAGLWNRLSRVLRAEEENPVRTETGGDPLPEQVRQSGDVGLWDRLSRALRTEDALPDPESPWSAYAARDTEKDGADARPALLEQLERAERTAEAAGFGTPRGRAAGRNPEAAARQTAESFPALEARGDGRWTLPRSFSRRPEEDLAAEIDRSFQRDGRRYDGGFYLF